MGDNKKGCRWNKNKNINQLQNWYTFPDLVNMTNHQRHNKKHGVHKSPLVSKYRKTIGYVHA